MEDFTGFAMAQFGKRVARLELARTQTAAQVAGSLLETEEDGDG